MYQHAESMVRDAVAIGAAASAEEMLKWHGVEVESLDQFVLMMN